jgi:hypothetical protein
LFRKKGRSLQAYLLALVAVALVPALAVGAWTAYLMLRDLRSSFDARLTESADAVAVAVDRQIETRRVALDTLSRAVRLASLEAMMAPDAPTLGGTPHHGPACGRESGRSGGLVSTG